ncbi:MAG TPA: RNA 2',3'-cyclic phosphodiesterase, partial [bacterium]|nr:RNA 2',3'-cyclic phosphodiesterase [bacterium]
RTFIAIKLTPEIASNISKLQEELKRTGAQVKWVKPENIHLTLKFLGQITSEELEKVKLTTRETLKPFKSFEISVSGLGAFPKINYPRVIWVGVDKGKEELKKIALSIEKNLARISFAKEKRPFSPHLTIGRVKSSRGRERLIEILTGNKISNLGNIRVTKISLVKSELTPQGPVYTSLEEIDLRGKEG